MSFFDVNLYADGGDQIEAVVLMPGMQEGQKFPEVLIHGDKYYVLTPAGKFRRREAIQVRTRDEYQEMNKQGIVT
jgi:hypothetical protein